MQVYVGIDWSQNKHDVAFCNAAGDILARATIPHSADGFEKLDATRAKIGVPPDACVVGLETAHNLLIDFLGMLCPTRAVAPSMAESRGGHIVNFSSMVGYLPVFGYTARGAAKFAARGLSDTLRQELKLYGIDASLVFPPDTDARRSSTGTGSGLWRHAALAAPPRY